MNLQRMIAHLSKPNVQKSRVYKAAVPFEQKWVSVCTAQTCVLGVLEQRGRAWQSVNFGFEARRPLIDHIQQIQP